MAIRAFLLQLTKITMKSTQFLLFSKKAIPDQHHISRREDTHHDERNNPGRRTPSRLDIRKSVCPWLLSKPPTIEEGHITEPPIPSRSDAGYKLHRDSIPSLQPRTLNEVYQWLSECFIKILRRRTAIHHNVVQADTEYRPLAPYSVSIGS